MIDLAPTSTRPLTSLFSANFTRVRSAPLLTGVLALALAGPGCSAPPPAPVVANGGLSTVSLPPAPVPATFDVAALAERVQPTVVNITTTMQAPPGADAVDPFDFFFGGPGGRPRQQHHRRQSLGTGFLIDPSGYIVTNAHVVQNASDVTVKLADDREFKADIVGRDPRLDIALLKLVGASNLPVAALGHSDPLRVGEHVLAVGNPFGLGHTVTLGIVSAKARSIGAGPYDDFIQTDASINPGNSGGPLFNWRGEVVGINTAIRQGATGIGFAIPIDIVKEVLGQLRQKGHVDRGKLGLGFQAVSADLAQALDLDSPRGALVNEIAENGPAAKAGIEPGDVVLAVDGTPIRHAEELPRRVAVHQPGSTIKVTLVHKKEKRDVTATLAALEGDEDGDVGPRRPTRPQADAPSSGLGVALSDMPGGQGVRVDDVTDPNKAKDFQPGDVILEVNGAPVRDGAALRVALAKAKRGGMALARIRRGRGTQFAALPVP